jgi:hypothetical protein
MNMRVVMFLFIVKFELGEWSGEHAGSEQEQHNETGVSGVNAWRLSGWEERKEKKGSVVLRLFTLLFTVKVLQMWVCGVRGGYRVACAAHLAQT